MASMLDCRTGPRCFSASSCPRTQNDLWRWRCSVSFPRPRLLSTCTSLVSSSATSSLRASFLPPELTQMWARKTQPLLNLFNRTFEWRCQAVGDELEEEAETAVLVVGGGILGMETVRALVDAGLLVAAYQGKETFDIPEMFHDDIEEMGWDVIDVKTIKKVLESNPFEAIVCTVGGGITRPDFDKEVPVKMVNAAKMAGVKRFVLVSSIGTEDGVKAVDEMTFKEIAEEAVKASELDYTIIRPGGLLSSPPTGNGILIEKSGIAGLISCADVAALIVEVLFNKKSYGKTLTAIDEDKLLPPTSSLDGVELISL